MFILQKKGIFFYLNTPSAPPHLWGGGGNGHLGGPRFSRLGGRWGARTPVCPPPTWKAL